MTDVMRDHLHLTGPAALGMVEAAQRFDPTRGVPFGAFAKHRIRGAVLDDYRRTRTARLFPLSLDRLTEEAGDRFPDPSPGPEQLVVEADERRRVREAVTHLEAKRRAVIEADLTGVVVDLGVSRRRVNQLRRDAHVRLRRELAA